MNSKTHCPYRQSTLLQQALAPDKMRIAFMLGAGCPASIRREPEGSSQPLIPDICGLTTFVDTELKKSDAHKESYAKLRSRLPSTSTIEDILTHLRLLLEVVRDGDGLDKASLERLDAEICRITTKKVDVDLPETSTPYHRLANWVGGIPRTHPIEIFTPNYDLLVEQAFEAYKIPYFDGFIGSRQAFFDLASMENEELPSRWGRLWKVHGSVNWWRINNGEVIRRDTRDTLPRTVADERQMIYPSHLKYDQSRRMPYLAMLDRLRSFLARGKAVLVTSGYSFRDQHLNEVILDGLRSNPTAVCFGLLFGPKTNYCDQVKEARKHPNLSLLATDGAVLGTIERDWRPDVQTGHPMHRWAVNSPSPTDANPKKNCEFLLGDFKAFGEFLARQLLQFYDEQVTPNAP
jgi:hypothetical protein